MVSVHDAVDSDRATDLRALVSDVAKASTAEPGRHWFDVVLPVSEPDHVLLFAVFDDVAAFEAHTDTPRFKTLAAETARIKATRTMTPGASLLSFHKP